MLKTIQKEYIKIIIVGGMVILGIVVYFYFQKQSSPTIPVIENVVATMPSQQTEVFQENVTLPPTQPQQQEIISTENISLIIGSMPISIPLVVGDTLYETLHNADVQGTILFSAREYPGLGFFVTAIGLLESGDGKNLMYFINGKEASVGVSMYVPHDGDVIEWKLK